MLNAKPAKRAKLILLPFLRAWRALRFSSARGARCVLRERAARSLQLGGPLDDRREHRAGVPAFRRAVRVPDRGRVLGEDVLEVTVALHAARRELGDVEVAGPVVAVLDEQPRPIASASRARIAPAGPHA